MGPGNSYSTSGNACIIKFTGGPWDGMSGLYDCDHSNLTIQTQIERIQYDYERVGPKHFALARSWDLDKL